MTRNPNLQKNCCFIYLIKGGRDGAYEYANARLFLTVVANKTKKVLHELDLRSEGCGAGVFDYNINLLKINNGTYYILLQLRRGGDGDHSENMVSIYTVGDKYLKMIGNQNIHEPKISTNGPMIELSGKYVITLCGVCDGWEVSAPEDLFLIPIKVLVKGEKLITKVTMGKKEKQEMKKRLEKRKKEMLQELTTYEHDPREEKYIEETSEEFYSIINK